MVKLKLPLTFSLMVAAWEGMRTDQMMYHNFFVFWLKNCLNRNKISSLTSLYAKVQALSGRVVRVRPCLKWSSEWVLDCWSYGRKEINPSNSVLVRESNLLLTKSLTLTVSVYACKGMLLFQRRIKMVSTSKNKCMCCPWPTQKCPVVDLTALALCPVKEKCVWCWLLLRRSTGQYGPLSGYPWWLMLCWVGSAHFRGRKIIAQMAVLVEPNYIIIS